MHVPEQVSFPFKIVNSVNRMVRGVRVTSVSTIVLCIYGIYTTHDITSVVQQIQYSSGILQDICRCRCCEQDERWMKGSCVYFIPPRRHPKNHTTSYTRLQLVRSFVRLVLVASGDSSGTRGKAEQSGVEWSGGWVGPVINFRTSTIYRRVSKGRAVKREIQRECEIPRHESFKALTRVYSRKSRKTKLSFVLYVYILYIHIHIYLYKCIYLSF